MCAAMPRRFVRHPASSMYALSAVAFGAPPCKNAACANIGFLKSQLCGGWVPCAACVLWLPRASLVSSSSVSCLLCGGGLLGLGEGHQACKSTEISHTSWRIFNLLFCIQCIDIVWGHHHLSPGSTKCTPRGFFVTARLFPQFSLAHPPWGSNPRPQG